MNPADIWDLAHTANTDLIGATPQDEVFDRFGIRPSGCRVLDLGVGTGEMSTALCNLGNDVVSCDISHCALLKVDTRAAVTTPDRLRSEQPFDVVLCFLVAQHLDPNELFELLNQIPLAPEGRIFLQFLTAAVLPVVPYPLYTHSTDSIAAMLKPLSLSVVSESTIHSGCFGTDESAKWAWTSVVIA